MRDLGVLVGDCRVLVGDCGVNDCGVLFGLLALTKLRARKFLSGVRGEKLLVSALLLRILPVLGGVLLGALDSATHSEANFIFETTSKDFIDFALDVAFEFDFDAIE